MKNRRGAPTLYGVVASACAFVALVGYSPSVDSLFWAPKAAAAVVLGAVGLVSLVSLVKKDRSWAPRVGASFLLLATVSAALAPDRTVAVFGEYRLGTGLIFVAALVGGWALGCQLTTRDRQLFGAALAAGITLNVVAAAAELVFDLSDFQLALYSGRTSALLGNPVHLGGLAAGATFVVIGHARSSWRWVFLGLPLGAALQTSGSRAALLLVAAAMCIAFLAGPRLPALLVAVSMAVGLGLGSILLGLQGGTPSTSRIQAGVASGGFDARLGTWWSARHAVAERPLLGAGPGGFGVATSRYRTLSIVRAEGADIRFNDAHNLFVEYLVTTGVLGVAALGLWLILIARRARGPFGLLGLGLLLLHLVEPQFVGTTPVAFMCLGAATSGVAVSSRDDNRTAWSRLTVVAALVAGLVAAGWLLRGDALLRRAELDFVVSDALEADHLLPEWPATAMKVSKLYSFAAIEQRSDGLWAEALRWRQEAARRQPSDPGPWIDLGEFDMSRGRFLAARRDFSRALDADPQSVRARIGLAGTLLELGHPEPARRTLEEAKLRPLSDRQDKVVEALASRARTMTP